MLGPPIGIHELIVALAAEGTLGECSCGKWRREAGSDTLVVTGLSRVDALRSAHERHARGLE